MKILAISRDESGLGPLAEPLRMAGHQVEAAASTAAADEALRGGHFDAIVVDLVGSADDEIAWLRSLRERRVRLGVVTVSALDAVDTRLAAIEAGADDHLVRPVDPRELVARCQALLRRQGGVLRSDVVVCGELVVDSRRREVRHGSVPIDLTPREWSILEFLVLHAGAAVTKDRLLRAIAGWDERLAPNAIEVYVSRLRGKLAGTGARISTVRGVGYRLEQPVEAA
ncbi:response regulator transcription factor [Burkholderiaceae bacterium FT117]|uniref:winged helix-turn-helix domain-containing protein n=1 Tax=Zeimonas sediminis TaxID=2944268 RepID=UPI002342F0AE|nr:response regulator transcription factor [Zeimonas sediminis]MCM5570544.1 response regulator transcription factor [Zeimonas sediminis]